MTSANISNYYITNGKEFKKQSLVELRSEVATTVSLVEMLAKLKVENRQLQHLLSERQYSMVAKQQAVAPQNQVAAAALLVELIGKLTVENNDLKRFIQESEKLPLAKELIVLHHIPKANYEIATR